MHLQLSSRRVRRAVVVQFTHSLGVPWRPWRFNLFFFASAIAQAALPIDIEVAAEAGSPFGAMQEWGKLLNEMDLARVRLRGANGGDEPSVTSTGEGESQRFKLVGILNRRDQLDLPWRQVRLRRSGEAEGLL